MIECFYWLTIVEKLKTHNIILEGLIFESYNLLSLFGIEHPNSNDSLTGISGVMFVYLFAD